MTVLKKASRPRQIRVYPWLIKFFCLLLAVCALFIWAVPGQAAEKKRPSPQKTPSPAVVAPQIRRTAVIQRQGSETILHGPLSIARDDKNGDIIVTSSDDDEVVILDKRGIFLKRLGLDGDIVTPYGVALDAKGMTYVSEMATGLLKVFNPAGSFEYEIDLSELAGKTVAPGRITLDKNGFLYIADLQNNEIMVLDDKGNFVRSLGTFNYLQKAGAIDDGRIVGVSAYGKAVQVFNRDGERIHAFGDHGDLSDKNFSFPAGFAVDAKGRLWIADSFQHRLMVFSLDGNPLFNYGRLQHPDGGFFFPVDLCFGDRGELFVLEKGGNRIQVLEVGDLVGEKRSGETEKRGNGEKAGN